MSNYIENIMYFLNNPVRNATNKDREALKKALKVVKCETYLGLIAKEICNSPAITRYIEEAYSHIDEMIQKVEQEIRALEARNPQNPKYETPSPQKNKDLMKALGEEEDARKKERVALVNEEKRKEYEEEKRAINEKKEKLSKLLERLNEIKASRGNVDDFIRTLFPKMPDKYEKMRQDLIDRVGCALYQCRVCNFYKWRDDS